MLFIILLHLTDIVPSIKNPELYFNSNVGGTFNFNKKLQKKILKN